jgi:hypothetical protein
MNTRCCVFAAEQHRDLKLENILYEHTGPDAGIKVGFAGQTSFD